MRSAVWGGIDAEITQEFNAYNPYYDQTGGYDYVEALGLEKGHHGGLDIGVAKGTQLYALNPGRVIQAGFSDSFRPSPVWIETEDNPETRDDESGYVEIFGHMWTNTVKAGDRVKPGQNLGTSGEQTTRGTWTPDGSGPHLHFELRRGGRQGQLVDPTGWLTGTNPAPIPGEKPTDDNGQDEPAPDDPGGGSILDSVTDIGKRAGIALVGLALLLMGVFILVADKTPAGAIVARLRGKR
jgi:hypothetical protein